MAPGHGQGDGRARRGVDREPLDRAEPGLSSDQVYRMRMQVQLPLNMAAQPPWRHVVWAVPADIDMQVALNLKFCRPTGRLRVVRRAGAGYGCPASASRAQHAQLTFEFQSSIELALAMHVRATCVYGCGGRTRCRSAVARDATRRCAHVPRVRTTVNATELQRWS